MGSKYRLLPWIHRLTSELKFRSALDAFAGSGCVAYLLKAMGKRVVSNDFLNFSYQTALSTIENRADVLSGDVIAALVRPNRSAKKFIRRTFGGVFFTPVDLAFLDSFWANMEDVQSPYQRSLALSALVRACVKHQPRGVFTVTGGLGRHDDGRRDLWAPLSTLFEESARVYNDVVFDNGMKNCASNKDVFDLVEPVDLVYLDPPYVPRADDNCYIKRYHFLEGLVSYWTARGTEILMDTKSRKIAKRYTPFSYRSTCIEAFDRLFRGFADSTIVLSYSSNGYPDLDVLREMLGKYKRHVHVEERPHRYHFGTHSKVSAERVSVREYLVIAE